MERPRTLSHFHQGQSSLARKADDRPPWPVSLQYVYMWPVTLVCTGRQSSSMCERRQSGLLRANNTFVNNILAARCVRRIQNGTLPPTVS